MAAVHDYLKFLKRGYGRGTDQASLDVRNGLLTQVEGFELAKKADTEKPTVLPKFLKDIDMTEEEMETIIKAKRAGKAKELP